MTVIKKIVIREKEIPVKINNDYGTYKVGDLFFGCKEDFILFINKLTDIGEEVLDNEI